MARLLLGLRSNLRFAEWLPLKCSSSTMKGNYVRKGKYHISPSRKKMQEKNYYTPAGRHFCRKTVRWNTTSMKSLTGKIRDQISISGRTFLECHRCEPDVGSRYGLCHTWIHQGCHHNRAQHPVYGYTFRPEPPFSTAYYPG